MAGFDPLCACCAAYQRALSEWRLKGGAMPKTTCITEHRAICKKCGEPHEGRSSGLCDYCYQKEPKKPQRFNPLDLVRRKAKRII